jgi:glycosyltransferase involved in cell wall biosynthesis
MCPFVIITPVLNGACFISENLAAISGQTDTSWVHYVVDGGSSDGTQEIVRRSLSDDSRRHLIEGHDRGLYDAIFKGFAQARLDGYVDPDGVCLWLNADDKMMPWAIATLRQAFDQTRADWITALPSLWDAEGRLVLVSPYAWHPRALIRLGLFHGKGLGWIQQESSFFTRRLLDRLDPAAIERICATKLAGDFLLWQEFARYAAPKPIPIAVSGFRSHGANASTTKMDDYYAELKRAGIQMIPVWLGLILRLFFRPVALLQAATSVRRQLRQISLTERTSRRN